MNGIIDGNWRRLLAVVLPRARGYTLVQAGRSLLRFADALFRAAAFSWLFALLAVGRGVDVGMLLALLAAEVAVQTAVAALGALAGALSERLDDRCMDDALRNVHQATPEQRERKRLPDRLADYRFDISYIGGVSRNIDRLMDFGVFACSFAAYVAGLVYLIAAAMAANLSAGIAVMLGTAAILAAGVRRALASGADPDRRTFEDILTTERRRMYYIFDIVHRYPVHAVLKTFHAEGFVKRRYRELNDRGLTENLAYLRDIHEGQRRLLVMQTAFLAAIAGALAAAAMLDASLLPMAPLFVGLGMQVMSSGEQAISSYRLIRRVSARLGNVADMLADVPQPTGGRAIDAIRTIDFDHVWFAYRDGAYVLRDLNLHLDADGSLTALVGVNGAGKSTLLSLILGELRPTKGRILVNGTDLRDLDIQRYQRLLGVLAQDHHLFSGTIRDNILAGRGSGRDPERLLRDLGADAPLIDRLDAHVESMENDNTTLSGGELQRVAIARTLARPGVGLYVLDEPTSAFDPAGERELFAHLKRLLHGTTGIIVTHDIRACANADRIIVLDHGAIAEQGGYRQLLRHGGPFARLHDGEERNRTTSPAV